MLSDLHHSDDLPDPRQMRARAEHLTSAFAPPASATTTEPDTRFAGINTDVSHLPDLTGYLDDLLRTRERLHAAIDGVDEWARAAATPSAEEISRIRRLISRIEGDLGQLPDAERAQIGQAVTVTRKHRAVSLGMPAICASTPVTEDIA